MESSQLFQEPKIKQEVAPEPTFFEQFSSIMASLEGEPVVTKELILKLAWLFQKDFLMFIECVEKAFLLVFRSYSHKNINLSKSFIHQLAKPYSNLFCQFLEHLIWIVPGMKTLIQTQEQQDVLNQFINFYLEFFSEGLLASKSFIKDFSFVMLTDIFKTLEPIFDPSIDQNTQSQLLTSTFNLLASKSDENKKLGFQLYAALKKLKVCSQEIDELLFGYMEKIQNYSMRRSVLRWCINLDNKNNLQRALNRLKDKNPIIAEQTINKLMNENISLTELTLRQRIKLLVDGYGSHQKEVSEACKVYFKNQFEQILHHQKQGHRESQIHTQTNAMDSSYLNASLVQMAKISKWDFFQTVINLFNYEKFQGDIFTQNPCMSSFICQMIYEITCMALSFQQINSLITKIIIRMKQQSCVTSQQCIFLYSLLKGIQHDKQVDQCFETKVEIRKFVNNSSQLCSYQLIIKLLTHLFKQAADENLNLRYFLLKIVDKLAVEFNLYDCVGKRKVYQVLKSILASHDFFAKLLHNQEPCILTQNNQNQLQKVLYQQLSKVQMLLNNKNHHKSNQTQLITCQADLVFTITDILVRLIEKEPSCQPGQLKLLLDSNIQNKQLRLQRQTLANMYAKKSDQLKSLKDKDYQQTDKKLLQNLAGMTKGIQKKINQNQLRIISNTLKAFFILGQLLSVKQKSLKSQSLKYCLRQFRASSYIEPIKNFLYNVIEFINISAQNSMKICWLPYLLIYNYCTQSQEKLNNFKKLFLYYAFEQQKCSTPKESLLQMISIRILVDFQLQSHIKSSQKCDQLSMINLAQKITTKIFDKDFQDSLKSQYLQQILIKLVRFNIASDTSLSVMIKLLVFSFNTHIKSSSGDGFLRIILMVYEQLLTNNNKKGIQTLLTFVQVINQIINSSDIKVIEDKSVIIMELRKMIKTLIKITKGSFNNLQTLSKNKHILAMIPFVLRAIQKQLSSQQALSSNPIILLIGLFQKQEKLNFTIIQTKALIHVKNQIEIFIEKLISKIGNPQIQNSCQILKNIQELIGYEIIDRLKGQESNIYEQQSTNHSFGVQKIQTLHQKVNSAQIDAYNLQLQNQLDFLTILGQKVFSELKQSNYYQHLCKQFICFDKKTKVKNKCYPKAKKQQIKLQQQIPIQSVIFGHDQQKSHTKYPFDKRGRRKQNKTSKFTQSVELQMGSIKKSRYVIIPFDIVESAEQKYCRAYSKSKGSKKIKPNEKTQTQISQASILKLNYSRIQMIGNNYTSSEQEQRETMNNKYVA